jgi:hypothetical protein
MQAGVLSLVNDTHSATAELLDDSIVGDGLADDGFGLGHFVLILGRGPETVKGMQGHGMPGGHTRISSGPRRCARSVSLLAKTRKEVEMKNILARCARPNLCTSYGDICGRGLLTLCAVID